MISTTMVIIEKIIMLKRLKIDDSVLNWVGKWDRDNTIKEKEEKGKKIVQAGRKTRIRREKKGWRRGERKENEKEEVLKEGLVNW